MRLLLLPALLSLSLLTQAAPTATIEVRFSHPENFTDANLDRETGRGASEAVLKELKTSIQHFGERYLQPGQRLSVDVRDVDLAGRFERWRGSASKVRVMREVTWPRIDLHYSLEQDGRETVSRDAVVEDKSYLVHGRRYGSSERLRYEKAMLQDWFRETFAQQPSKTAH